MLRPVKRAEEARCFASPLRVTALARGVFLEAPGRSTPIIGGLRRAEQSGFGEGIAQQSLQGGARETERRADQHRQQCARQPDVAHDNAGRAFARVILLVIVELVVETAVLLRLGLLVIGLGRGHNAQIVFGMLEIAFRHDDVAGGLGVAA